MASLNHMILVVALQGFCPSFTTADVLHLPSNVDAILHMTSGVCPTPHSYDFGKGL